MLISRRRRGRCAALTWSEEGQRYLCGALAAVTPVEGTPPTMPRRWLHRLVLRWIGAGVGCDAHLDRVDLPPTESTPQRQGPSEDGP